MKGAIQGLGFSDQKKLSCRPGVSGSLFATPIINQPQAGILGVGAIKKQVVVIEDEFGNDATAIRPMGYLSCSFDHRILDGVSADSFVAAVVNHLENWE